MKRVSSAGVLSLLHVVARCCTTHLTLAAAAAATALLVLSGVSHTLIVNGIVGIHELCTPVTLAVPADIAVKQNL